MFDAGNNSSKMRRLLKAAIPSTPPPAPPPRTGVLMRCTRVFRLSLLTAVLIALAALLPLSAPPASASSHGITSVTLTNDNGASLNLLPDFDSAKTTGYRAYVLTGHNVNVAANWPAGDATVTAMTEGKTSTQEFAVVDAGGALTRNSAKQLALVQSGFMPSQTTLTLTLTEGGYSKQYTIIVERGLPPPSALYDIVDNDGNAVERMLRTGNGRNENVYVQNAAASVTVTPRFPGVAVAGTAVAKGADSAAVTLESGTTATTLSVSWGGRTYTSTLKRTIAVTVTPGDGELTVRWTEGAKHKVRWKASDADAWLNPGGAAGVAAPPQSRAFIVPGLTNGTAYDVEVYARDRGWARGSGTPAESQTQSTDADLRSPFRLVDDTNAVDLSLDPAFNPATTAYKGYTNASKKVVARNTASVTVHPIVHAEASVTVNGESPSVPVSLTPGANTITVVVTAEAGNAKSYVITVERRKSGDASLSEAPTVNGNHGRRVGSRLSGTTGPWNVNVNHTVASVSIVLTPNDPLARVARVVDNTKASPRTLTDAGSIGLEPGKTKVINIYVAAQDGTERAYRFNITRASVPAARVIVSPTTLSVSEGGTATYTVRLTAAPTDDVVVETRNRGSSVFSIDTEEMTFTSTNYNQAQTVTVTGLQDADAEDGTGSITHSAESDDADYDNLDIAWVNVTVTDDETPSASTKTYKIDSAVTANEGANAELTITLGENAPSGNLAFTVTPTYDSGTGKAVAADVGMIPTSVSVSSGSTTATLTIPIARDALEEGAETFTVAIATTETGWTVASDGTASATVTITDTTETVSFAMATYAVDEGESVSVVVRRTGSTAEDLDVTVSTATGSAGSADYTALNSKTVTIAAGSATANVAIQTTDDDLDEGTGESFTVTIAAPAGSSGYRLGAQSSATVTITDDDDPAPSTVTLTVANASVAEDVGSVTITATLDNAAGSSGVSVRVAAGGTSTATATADYSGLPANITIGDGETTGTASVTIVDDDVDEDNETIVLTPTSSGLSGTGTTLTITDNDDAGVTVSESALSVTAPETATYTVVLDTKPTHSVTITPTSGATDKATVSAAVVFTTANWSTPKEITVTGVAAGNATITHAASSTDTNYQSGLSIGEVAVTVAAAAPSTKTYEITGAVTANEGEDAELTVTLGENAPSDGLAFTVTYDYSGSAATTADTGTTPTTVTVPENMTTVTLTIPIAADAEIDPNETFTVAIEPTTATGWTVASGGVATATVTITDTTPTISFTSDAYSVAEDASDTAAGNVLTVTISAPSDFLLTRADITDGSATGGGVDYTGVASLSVFTGSASEKGGFATLVDDDLVEDDETVTVTLRVPAGYAAGDHTTATITITDDDRADAKIAFGSSAASTAEHTVSVDENVTAGTLNVPVTVSHLPGANATFTVEVVAEGTTAGSGDYSLSTDTVTFGPTDSSKTKNAVITLTDDDAVEEDETIKLRIVPADNPANDLGDHYARHANGGTATVTINSEDQEAPSTKTYKITSAATANEGANAELTVTLGENAPSDGLAFTVTYDYSGSAATTADTGTTQGTITVAEDTKTVKLTIPIAADAEIDPDETFTVAIAPAMGVTGWTVASDGTASGTVTITDTTETVSFEAATYSRAEDGGAFFVRVVRSGGSGTLNVAYTTGTGSATSGDFQARTGSINMTGNSAAIRIVITDDQIDEDNEDFTVRITGVTGGNYAVGAPSTTTVTIIDNDDAGVTVNKSSLNVTATEAATYTVVLDTKPTQNVTITPTSDDTDKATVSAAVVFTTANWQTPKEITVTGVAVGDATITHAASSTDTKYPSSLSIDDVDVMVTAAAPSTKTYKIDSAVTANEGEDAELTITLGENAPSGNLAFTVTPTYDSGTGKAVAADVGMVPTSVSVSSGSTTATLTIPIARDALEEGAETFTVAIATTETGWTVASDGTASATVTITDTTEAVSFSMATYAVDEGESATVVVSRTGSTTEALDVTVSTTNGTAGSADYSTLTSETVTIAVGSSSANVAIQTTEDDLDEGTGESFTVTIAAPAANTGYRLGTQSSATVTITDDDDAGVTVSKESLSVTAGQTGAYTVVLDTKPTASVTITPTSGTPANATVTPSSLTFTTTNWQTPQTVTVTGVKAGDSAISHAVTTSTDTKYPTSLSIGSVDVTVAAAAPSTKTYKITSAVTANEGEDAELTITLGENAPSGNLAFTVTPTYDSGTGKAVAADVGMIPTSVTVASGSTTATLTIPIARDALEEGAETFTVAIATTETGWTVASDGTASATVTITDTTEAVSFSMATYAVDEGESATVVVSRTGSTAEALDVRVSTATGTAGSADYTGLSSETVTIAAGSATANVAIQTTDDDLDEGTGETFTVTIAAPSADTGYRLGTQSSATVTITDDDDAGVTVSEESLSVTAGDDATYTVVLTSKPTQSVTITPTSGTPANATVSGAVTFTTTNWQTPKTITVTGVKAGSSTITHAASSTDTKYPTSLSIDDVEVTVTAMAVPVVQWAQATYSVTETDADQELELTINFAPALTGTTALTVGQSGGDAANSGTNVDWAFKPGTVCVAGTTGDTSATCIIVIKGDDIAESAETIELTISAVPVGDATIGAQNTTTVTITDDDAPPAPSTVTLSVANASVAENVGTVTVTATLDNAAGSSGVSVRVAAGGTSTATATADYSGLPATISIGDGETTGTASVTIVDDDVDEDSETIVLTPTSSGLTGTGTTLTITDNDDAGVTVSESALSVTAPETAIYTVVLDTKPTHSVTITPNSGDTDKATVSAAVVFTTANWSTPKEITVTGVAAGNATISHAASSTDTNYQSSLSIGEVAVTVAAAELPTVSFEAAAYEVREPDSGNITLNIPLDCSSGDPRVSLQSADAGATLYDDYTFVGSVGQVSTACTVGGNLYIRSDNVPERRPETFTVTILENASAYELGDITETTVTILDFHAPETLTINGTPEKTSSTITVKWDYPPYKFPNITETLVWAQNVDDATDRVYKTVLAPNPPPSEQSATLDGLKASTTYAVRLRARNMMGIRGTWSEAVEVTTAAAQEQIDREPERLRRTYSVNAQATAAEGGDAALTITLSHAAPAEGVEFTVTAGYGDGAATSDDVGSITSPVTISEGNDTLTIAVPTVDDRIDEENETFTVTIATGAAGWEKEGEGQDTATVTIIDDDTAGVMVTAANPLTVAEDGTVTYTVVLDSRPTHYVTIAAASGDGSKAAVAPASHTIAPSAWNTPVTFTVSGVADEDSSDETVDISHRVTSQDGKYAAVTVGDVSVAVSDTTPQKQEQQDPPPNQSPTVSSAIEDATIVNESGTKEVTLSGVFDDADNDDLTITAGSSGATVATVSVASDYSTLTMTAQARGTATITVTAADGNGGTVSDTFTVTVKAAPVVASAIADVTGLEAGSTQDISLAGVFSDADGDSLTITAASSDDALVSAFVFRNTLTIVALAEGTETITVTAQDSDGNSVSDTFEVSVVKKYAALIAQMYEWRNDPQWVDNKTHTDRWDRALLAFGETVSDASLTPMTADEAQELADRGWQRWVEVAKALRDIEGG